MVPLFAKSMDTLAEDLMKNDKIGVRIGEEIIPSLLFMDDVVSAVEGYKQEEETLNEIQEFSVKHQFEWGQDKCQVMEIGNHKEKKNEWKLGQKSYITVNPINI